MLWCDQTSYTHKPESLNWKMECADPAFILLLWQGTSSHNCWESVNGHGLCMLQGEGRQLWGVGREQTGHNLSKEPVPEWAIGFYGNHQQPHVSRQQLHHALQKPILIYIHILYIIHKGSIYTQWYSHIPGHVRIQEPVIQQWQFTAIQRSLHCIYQ